MRQIYPLPLSSLAVQPPHHFVKRLENKISTVGMALMAGRWLLLWQSNNKIVRFAFMKK